ncbi:MAG: NACHT domain-containing protein, partial [Nocardioidaceae bacterium]|nr:NACHT domain-containing protein [Nocardioidaceae bacterium]
MVLFTYNANETAAVLDAFPGDVKREEVREGVTYTDLGLIGGHRVVLRVSEQGPGRAQLAAEDACRVWAPKALISVGIAFGADPARQSIGDVLVPRAAYDYESQRRSPGGVIEPRGLPYPASDVLYGRVRHLDQTQTSLQHWPRVWGGLLLSGAKLIDDAEVKREIARLAPTEPDGGEMEGVGVAMVAGARKVDWLLVKGICDWADGNVRANEKENNQRTAARNAVIVVRALLSDGPLWGDPQPKPTWAPPPTGEGMQVRELGRLTHLIEDQTGTVVGFHKDWSLDRASELLERRAEGVDVLNALLEWIDGTGEAKVFAILGEYGMGKTITCQRLARALEQRLQRTQTGPIPLYFDLRLVTGLSSQLPTLEQVLTECMQRGWLADTTSTFTSDQVFAWIAHGAVVIFDGLDEVLVKLDAADGQTFTRTLLSIVDRAPTPTRVVVSCRTQYFKTLRDQQNHFTGHERGDAGADTFRALTLLPLTEEQVLAYLRGVLPGEDPDRVVDVLRSVHNLEDLSHRPYTLSLIADFFPALEARRA